MKKPQKEEILDSYSLFLDRFCIEKESFYTFGIESTIFPPLEYAKSQWDQNKKKLLGNDTLAIRGYGRQGKNTEMFLGLYKYLFKNERIYEDSTNNAAPRANIQAATGHRINSSIYNYQCSHIFGRTKNPILFESVWNMCFVPRIFDPLTGHEATGAWPQEYQELFVKKVCLINEDFIRDFNMFIIEHNISERIKEYVFNITGQYDNKTIHKFAIDAQKEWAPIEIETK